jgi:DNA-binding transcriptional LysR family regulator
MPVVALARETRIVRESGSGTRAAMEEFLRAHQVQPVSLIEIPSDEAIQQAVMAGQGVSVLSRRWQLVRGSGTELSPAAEAFRCFLLESGRGARLRCRPHAQAAGSRSRISTRRFMARPASELLSATGSRSPRPSIWMRVDATPWAAR